jgi:lactoylglutathione lyase
MTVRIQSVDQHADLAVPEVNQVPHFAIAVGSDALVDQLTQRLKEDGVPVLDGPRRTGDGYYESVVLDADGNRIEITS